MVEQPRILCVCADNCTRSVIAAALLRRYTSASTLAPNTVDVGLGPSGLAIADGVGHALAEHGIYVYSHLSHQLTDRIASEAHLVLAAERAHVVNISTRARNLFARSFTLPEFIARATNVGPRDGASIEEWVARVDAGRRPQEYAQSPVAMIEDPTGLGADALRLSVNDIDLMCQRFGDLWG
ncbi:MAG TPA: hypothetical protein VGM78_09310 [Ilumatobacteraceae bacterium]